MEYFFRTFTAIIIGSTFVTVYVSALLYKGKGSNITPSEILAVCTSAAGFLMGLELVVSNLVWAYNDYGEVKSRVLYEFVAGGCLIWNVIKTLLTKINK